MVKVSIKSTNGLDKLLKKLESKSVESGFYGEEAQIASQNEYGGYYPVSEEYRERALAKGVKLGESIKIIPRPFMSYTFDDHYKEWVHEIKKDLKANDYDTNKTMKSLGKRMKSNIQNTMLDSGLYYENPEFVQQIKGNNTPLIDSGHLLNSVEYNVK